MSAKQGSGSGPDRSLARNTAVMASGTLVSRILGLVRNALLVATIGALSGGMADAFAVANTLPNIIYNLLAGGVLNAILVPQIVRALKHKERGQDYVNRLLTIGGLALAVVTVILTLASTLLINLYAASFNGEWKQIAIVLGYWCIPQLFFYGLYTLIGQVLNARSNFGPYMWAPVVNNVVAIIGLVAFLVMYGAVPVTTAPSQWTSTMIMVLAGTATLGVVFQALVLIVPLVRSGFKFRPRLKPVALEGMANTGKFAGWVFAGLAMGQLSFLAISNVSAAAGSEMAKEGILGAGNAAYSNAFMIMMLPQSLITISLVTAMFTQLSKNAAEWNHHQIRTDMSFGIRTLGVFSVLATALFMVLAIPVTQVIQFDRADFATYQATGNVLVALAMSLVPLAIWTINMRVYYAYSDAKSVFRFQAVMGISAALGAGLVVLVLPAQWWVVGASSSLTFSYWLGALISYLALRRKLPSIDGARILRTYLRLLMAIIPSALIGWGLLHLWGVETGLFGAIARVLVIGAIISLSYVFTLRFLGLVELDSLLDRLGRMAAPITRRLTPVVSKLPGGQLLRTIWKRTGQFRRAEGDQVEEQTPVLASAGDVLADRYRVDESLPASPLAHFHATDQILDQRITLAVVAGPHRSDVLAAARRSALITHAAFPKILRVIEEDDRGIIVCQPAEFTSLTALITSNQLSTGQLRALVGEAAKALDIARKRGGYHLALTPTNVGVSAEGEVVITGLGIDASARGYEAGDTTQMARTDAVGLIGLLHAGLYGTWPNEDELAGGLPTADAVGTYADGYPEHDSPKLAALCELVLNSTQDGPFNAAEVATALGPWDPLRSFDVKTPWLPTLSASQLTATTAFDSIVEPTSSLPSGPARHPASQSEDAAAAPTATPEPASAPSTQSPADTPAPQPDSAPLEVANAVLPVSPRVAALISSGAPVAAPATPSSASKASALAERAASIGAVAGGAAAAAGTKLKSGFTATSTWLADKINRLNQSDDAPASEPVQSKQERAVDKAPRPATRPAAPIILTLMAAVVVAALFISINVLRNAPDAYVPVEPATPVPTTVAPEDEDEDEDDATQEPTTPAPKPTVQPPEITSATTYDPAFPGGENQDTAFRIFDGDTSTAWHSLRYNNPTYGVKAGLGVTLGLAEEATISKITLHMDSSGGLVQVRIGSGDPDSGDVIAEGPMSSQTVFELAEPITVSELKLWFPELPQSDRDGRNRIELAEVELS